MASKLLERIFMEGFLKHIPQDFQVVAEREAPDFLLSDARGSLGLRLHRYSLLGASRAPRRKRRSRNAASI